MSGLPGSLADFGPAALAAVVVAGYLVVGEPVVGHVLHRRFEGRLRSDPRARRSFYLRLLILEWGLSLLALAVWLSAPDVDAAQVGLRWPQQLPGPVTGLVVLLVLVFVVVSTRALRGGALLEAAEPARRAGEGRHAEPPAHALNVDATFRWASRFGVAPLAYAVKRRIAGPRPCRRALRGSAPMIRDQRRDVGRVRACRVHQSRTVIPAGMSVCS